MGLGFPQSPAMPTLRCISSMATRALLADLIAAWPEPVQTFVEPAGLDLAFGELREFSGLRTRLSVKP